MALATRCPNCQALFRVVADQLKLRGGLVRCGACRHVFDAIGSLTYVDDAAPVSGAPKPVAAKAAAPLTLRISPDRPARSQPAADDDRARALDPQRAGARAAQEPAAAQSKPRTDQARPSLDEEIAESSVPTLLAPSTDALGRASNVQESAGAERSEVHGDDEDQRMRAQQRQRRAERRAREANVAQAANTGAEQVHDDADEQPQFLRRDRQRAGKGFSVVFGGGSALLAALLLAQLAVVFRIELATRWPALRPTLVQLCAAFGCTVGWPARADLLAVVGTELQAVPGTDVLELTAVVRNRANFKVALPAIEVTLTDTQNRALARKVFAPVDYLASAGEPSSRIDEGLAAGSDYTIRVAFEARGIAAVGFLVYPFYL
ncbi:MAG: DUF3426 domain-containing protein [Burkholderiaceae bacterium]